MKPAAPTPSGWLSLAQWGRDLRYATRSLRRAPAFSFAVVCSLVVCIGPNAAILSALYALVLKPLPFRAPNELVTVVNVAEKSAGQVLQSSMSQYSDFKDRANLFSGFTVVRHAYAMLDDDQSPMRIVKDGVTIDFFDVLGVQPLRGRFFSAEEGVAGRDNVVVVCQSFWESHYNADANIVGRQVRIDSQAFTIVGVAPNSLASLYKQTTFFQPYAPSRARFDAQLRYRGDVTLYGRLKSNVPIAAGLAQLTALETDFQQNQAPAQIKEYIANAGFRLALEPLHTGGVRGDKTQSLWFLQASALLVLLIGCVNVMNLFLARMNAKRTELSIRIALGAGRIALLRQLLAESFLLTGIASAAGIAFAIGALRVFNIYLPVIVPAAPPVTFHGTVAAVTIGTACVVALIVGVVPLQLVWRSALRASDSRTASSSGSARMISHGLVTAQVALAMVLLMGASLLTRSFAKVLANDPGFEAAHIVQGRLNLPKQYTPTASLEQRYRDPKAAANIGLQRKIVEALASIPGVERVAETLDPVLDPNIRPVPFATRNATDVASEAQPLIHIAAVSPEFFATMGLRVISGRAFNDADDFSKTPVAIVDESFRRRYFPNRIVEGQEIFLSKGLPLAVDGWSRIVGVVSRANLTGLDSRDTLPIVYVPIVGYPVGGFGLLVRSSRAPSDIIGEMRAKLREVDSSLALYSTESLQSGLDNLLLGRRGILLLLGLFSGVALLLAAIGLYGVLSYDVTQRTREIGIRGAIGATRGAILAMILRQGAWRTSIGLAVGTIGTFFLTHYMESLLFGVAAVDPASYVAVLATLAVVSLAACWFPAQRAARVDPIVALRDE